MKINIKKPIKDKMRGEDRSLQGWTNIILGSRKSNKMDENELNLDQFHGTEHYYKHFTGLLYTDGIKYLVDKTNCYWFIGVIASYQKEKKVKNCPFQIWQLKVYKDHTAMVSMREDTHEPNVVFQEVHYTDFPLDEIEVYCIDGVILLKSEY